MLIYDVMSCHVITIKIRYDIYFIVNIKLLFIVIFTKILKNLSNYV